MKITMGCDPELFLFDNIKQRIVPAIGKIGGSKIKPLKVEGGMVQLDGTVLEFGIDPDGDIQTVINAIRTKLENRYHGRYELRCGSTVAYHPDDIDPNSSHLDVGCSAQYKFTEEGNLVELDTGVSHTDINRVHAGGHIHIGFTSGQSITDPVMLRSCKMFADELIPISSILIGDSRRVHDVLAMNVTPVVRVKPYGIEFRNPCSRWLADSEIFGIYTALANVILESLQAGSDPYETKMYRELERNLKNRASAIYSAGRAVPAKYQGTLPLDY